MGMELEEENHAASAAGGQDGESSSGTDASSSTSPLFSIALVCQSNVNRSMEAHALLLQKKLPVHIQSYGVGQSSGSSAASTRSPALPLTACFWLGCCVRRQGASAW